MITSKSEAGLLSFFISMGFMILFDKSILKVKIHRNFDDFCHYCNGPNNIIDVNVFSKFKCKIYIYVLSAIYILMCVNWRSL